MDKPPLSSRIILILARDSSPSHPLKTILEQLTPIVDLLTNVHEAAIHAIFKEPDDLFIEVAPDDFSGLRLLDILGRLKGNRKVHRAFLFAKRSYQNAFRVECGEILFIDHSESALLLPKVRRLLEGPMSPEKEWVTPWIRYQERPADLSAGRKELEVLEKLGQLGILKKA